MATKMQAEDRASPAKTLLLKVSLCADGHSMSHTHATHLATEHHVTEHAVHLPGVILMLFYSTMSIMSIDNKNFTHCALNNLHPCIRREHLEYLADIDL